MKTPLFFSLRIKKYPQLKKLLGLAGFNPTVAFNELEIQRGIIPKDMYSFYLRMLFQANTNNAPIELILRAFKNVNKSNLMDRKEMRKFNMLPNEITIYRGTDAGEIKPRLSWSLDEKIARQYYTGALFKAVIDKNQVIAYFDSNTNENEIVAYVPKAFSRIG